MDKNKIVYILLTILLISSISISVYYRYYTIALETQISDKETIIFNLKNKQGVNDNVDILTKDSTLVFTLGDIELSPEDLIRYVNNLTKDIYLIQDSLSYYRAYYSLSQKFYNHGFKEEKKVLGSTKIKKIWIKINKKKNIVVHANIAPIMAIIWSLANSRNTLFQPIGYVIQKNIQKKLHNNLRI